MSWQGRQRDNMPAQKKKSTDTQNRHTHIHTRKYTTKHAHRHTRRRTQTHSCSYEGVSWQAQGQNNFLRFVMWNPAGILHDRKQRPRHRGGLLPLSRAHSLYYFVLQWWKEVCTSQRLLSPNYFNTCSEAGERRKFTKNGFSLLTNLLRLQPALILLPRD